MSFTQKTKKIGITIGDPNGIGPEVVVKALSLIPVGTKKRICLIADKSVLTAYGLKSWDGDVIDVVGLKKNDFKPGTLNPQAGQAALRYLHCAIELIKQGRIFSLVTAPVAKEGIVLSGVDFVGHTEYLAQHFNVKRFGMLFVASSVKLIIVTRHIPLNEVSKQVTVKGVIEAIELLQETLTQQFKLSHPLIGVCGLNPHAGEGGTIGKEECTKIIPAIVKMQQKGINVVGPISADTLFIPSHLSRYAGIVAMYHDQGLIPIKSLFFPRLVNLTVGLPFVRTSPAHGTAFDIAGKNKADPASMVAAIKLAATFHG